ncbi:MAG: hypothetical protein EU530_02660 [Promethearchaeota archaeon]|nr:MAG: hypothetical protein EU530_02660 [Candidatus Lokiarchaeota archaeon]
MDPLHLTVYCQFQNNPISNNIKFFLRPILKDRIKSIKLVYRPKEDSEFRTLLMNIQTDSMPSYQITIYEAPAGLRIEFFFIVAFIDGCEKLLKNQSHNIEYTILKSHTTTLRMDLTIES